MKFIRIRQKKSRNHQAMLRKREPLRLEERWKPLLMTPPCERLYVLNKTPFSHGRTPAALQHVCLWERADIMFVCSARGTCLAWCTVRCHLIHLAAKPRARSSDTHERQLQTKQAFIKYKPFLQVIFRHSLDTSLDTICGWSVSLIYTWTREKKSHV